MIATKLVSDHCYGCSFLHGACGCLECERCGFTSLLPLQCVDDESSCYLCPKCIEKEAEEDRAAAKEGALIVVHVGDGKHLELVRCDGKWRTERTFWKQAS